MVDTHAHAPQFVNLGNGLDMPLLEWLKTYTFPAEACFKDEDHAKRGTSITSTITITHAQLFSVCVKSIPLWCAARSDWEQPRSPTLAPSTCLQTKRLLVRAGFPFGWCWTRGMNVKSGRGVQTQLQSMASALLWERFAWIATLQTTMWRQQPTRSRKPLNSAKS